MTILERATFEFTQDANCVNENQGCEFLTIEAESSLGIGRDEDCFFVLKTNGWSLDSEKDLKILFDKIKKGIL